MRKLKVSFLYFVSFLIGSWILKPEIHSAEVITDSNEFSSQKETKSKAKEESKTRYNVLFIICDQESFSLLASDEYKLPAREKLSEKGVTFENHYIGSAMCTPSRGVIFTGQPPQVNGIFDQMEKGYVPSLDTNRPSLGTIMKKLGYKTAYYGKFELDKQILHPSNKINYTNSLQTYGFDEFQPDGDKTGKPEQGFDTDVYTFNETVRWLRTNTDSLRSENKPWFMVMSGVNPHDVMYADANLPGEKVQTSETGAKLTPPPEYNLYKKKWNFSLSPSLDESLKTTGHPSALLEYYTGWSEYLGYIPNTRKDMWKIFYNYYLNLIKDSDNSLSEVLDALDDLDVWKNTIVIFTADHGDMAGSHGGLRGKGPFVYENNAHVPMIIVHPDYKGGKTCKALTSHIDMIPTIVNMTNSSSDEIKEVLDGLPGKDISVVLGSPDTAQLDTVRDAILFNYVSLFTIDSVYTLYARTHCVEGESVPPLKEKHPDLSKRGFLSFVFNGRYKFGRYYSPDNFNTPLLLEDIYKNNDIQLFDLTNDPDEVKNMAVDSEKNKDIILKMNTLLNDMIKKEVGNNNGQFLPEAVRPPIK